MVKFTKELKYNAIEEWRAHYVNYAQLKKLIYGEEKHQVAKTTSRKSGAHMSAHHTSRACSLYRAVGCGDTGAQPLTAPSVVLLNNGQFPRP